MFFLIMGCTTAGLKSSGTAAVRREPFMMYRTAGPTAGGAGRGNDSRPHVNNLVYKESEGAADSSRPAVTGGLTPVFILLKKTPGLSDCV